MKLVLFVSGMVLASGAVLAFLYDRSSTRSLEKQIAGRLEDRAFHAVDVLDRYFYERLLDARTFASGPRFASGAPAPPQIAELLGEYLRWRPQYVSAAFYDRDGTLVADTAREPAAERTDLDGARAELATGRELAIVVSRPPAAAKPVLLLASVVRDGGGAERGLLVSRLPLAIFGGLMGDASGPHTGADELRVDLMDRNGLTLYSNDDGHAMLRVSPDWKFIEPRLRAGRTSGKLQYVNPAERGDEQLLFFIRERGFRDFQGSDWTLSVEISTGAAFAPAVALRNRMTAVLLLACAALLVVVFLLSRSFVRPIEEFGRVALEIASGNLEARVPVGSNDELGRFAETFNRMATSVQQAQLAVVDAKRDLERVVEERTAELVRMNEQLRVELTERARAQDSLRASEQRFRELFETSSDGIYRTDAAGVFTSMNPAGARILGHATPAEIIGRPSPEYWRVPAEREDFRERLRRDKSVSAYLIHAKKFDGSYVELEASSRILEDGNGAFLGIEGVLRDSTQRMRADAERDFLIAELQEAAANIRTLTGLLPICAGCKKIRNEQGGWSPVETYVSSHTDAEFTHGMCPDCARIYFPSA